MEFEVGERTVLGILSKVSLWIQKLSNLIFERWKRDFNTDYDLLNY